MKQDNKVMVFGAFDILHPGHLDFLCQAKSYGNFLIVSVARDKNIKKVKGSQPVFDESERLQMISGLKMVDKAVLGSEDDPVEHIVREDPDVIALGYDQETYIEDLEEILKAKGCNVQIVRLEPYRKEKYKTSKIREKVEKWLKHINS